MTTPRDLLTLSLKDIGALGIGQTPSAEDLNDAFTTANQLISEWALKRWMIYHLVDTGLTSTGAQSYTVGPGGDYNIAARPDKLEAAFVRQLNVPAPANQPDYPLQIITAYEDYVRIVLKQQGPFPSAVFYNPTNPLGVLYPWPVPQASIYAVHILTKAVLARFTSLDETITLPAIYESVIRWNAAKRLQASYPFLPPRPMVNTVAAETLSTLKDSTFAIATLHMPTPLLRGRIYNPYSDQGH